MIGCQVSRQGVAFVLTEYPCKTRLDTGLIGTENILVKWDFVLFLLKEEVCKEDFHERKKSMHHTKTDIFFLGNCNIKGFTASI